MKIFGLFSLLGILSACATGPTNRLPASDEHAASPAQISDEAPADSVEPCYKVDMGSHLNVAAVLNGVASKGTFTGSLEGDRTVLLPWFGQNTGPGSEIFEASKDSPPFFRALQFVSGVHTDLNGELTWQDYVNGDKMAAVLAAMMATATDPECTQEMIKRAKKILGPVAAELKDLPALSASDDEKNGDIDTKYGEIEKTRLQLARESARSDAIIAKEEKLSRADFAELKATLEGKYKDLLEFLSDIPSCSLMRQFDVFVLTKENENNPRVQLKVAPCRDQIEARLQGIKDEEAALTDNLKPLEDEHKKNPDAKALPQEKELNDKLEALAAKARKFEGFLEMLIKPDVESASGLLAELRSLVDNQRDPLKDKYKSQLRGLSNEWLTYGYFSYFGTRPTGSSGLVIPWLVSNPTSLPQDSAYAHPSSHLKDVWGR